MGNLFAELKRRHIYRVAAAYAVVAWVLIQLVNNVAPALKLPDWTLTLVIILLAVGFPIALVFAWILQLASTEGAPARAATGKLDWALIGALVVVIALVSYQQLAPSQATRTVQRQASVAASAQLGGISIAVLPFANLSGDASQEFFSDGITEEIAGALAKVPDLHLVARSSAFEFKGRDKEARSVGQALGATHLIEGSVRKAGNRVRITAQLVRADSGLQLWTENYDRELTDIFATQEDIAQAIAGALKVPLGLQQGDTLVRDRTKDLESYDQYLRARALYRERKMDEAITILEPLVARDSGFAPGWALLARAYESTPLDSGSTTRNGPIEDARRFVQSFQAKAEMAANHAIQLDSRNAAGYAVLARIQSDRGKWAESEDLYRKALTLDPNDPDNLNFYSGTLANVGRLKEALPLAQQVRMLEPLVPAFSVYVGWLMQAAGQNQAAIPIIESANADIALSYFRNVFLAQAHAAAGRYSVAADMLLAIQGNVVSRQSVEDAARLIRTAPAKAASPGNLPVLEGQLSFVYFYIGTFDRVMEFPERLVAIDYATSIPWGLWRPEFSPLRKTERFKALMRKAGLVEYWRARGWPDLCRPMGADDFVCD